MCGNNNCKESDRAITNLEIGANVQLELLDRTPTRRKNRCTIDANFVKL